MGYDNVDKKLIINENEAITVKRLFELYLANDCVRDVLEIAQCEGVKTKRRSDGSGGRPLTRGPLYYLLANPIYAGNVRSGNELFEGVHDAIIDRKTWGAVQDKRLKASQRAGKKSSPTNPLAGKLFAEGDRLTPTHSNKGGQRYRYYITGNGVVDSALTKDRWRISADTLERTIVNTIDTWLISPDAASILVENFASARQIKILSEHLVALAIEEKGLALRTRIQKWVDRIERVDILEDDFSIIIKPGHIFDQDHEWKLNDICTIRSKVNIDRSAQGLRLIVGETELEKAPARSLCQLLLRAKHWRDRWFSHPETSLSALAKEARTHPANISMEIKLAFLAPDIVKAILDGTVPSGINAEYLKRLEELPPSWSEQRRLFGLPKA